MDRIGGMVRQAATVMPIPSVVLRQAQDRL